MAGVSHSATGKHGGHTMQRNPDLLASVAGVRALFAAAACSCALVDDEGATLTFVAADGEGADAIIGVELPVSRGLAGWAVMSGQAMAIRDVKTDARFARDVAEKTGYVPDSVLAAPMFDDQGEALGVLQVLDPGVDQSADWTLAVLGTLASQVAMIVSVHRRLEGGADDARLAELGRRLLDAAEGYQR